MIDTGIVNAKVVTSRETVHGCIAIDKGTIQFVEPCFLMPESREVIDAEDRFGIAGSIPTSITVSSVPNGSLTASSGRT